MSIRAIGGRLFKHGTAIVRSLYKRDYNTSKIAEKVDVVKEFGAAPQQINARYFALRNVGLQVGIHARRLFVNSVLNRVTNSLAAELRKKAARRMLFGDSGPFFALVGVSLASGTGILTKDDELEGICLEIRDAVSKIKWNESGYVLDDQKLEEKSITLSDLKLGEPIAKGCSAVVYAAKLVDQDENVLEDKVEDTVKSSVVVDEDKTEINVEMKDSITKYPLALKMMFNYDVQSNAMAILRAMYRETVPARKYYSAIGIRDWELNMASHTAHLGPHPNIVAMYSVFTDYVREFSQALDLYPAALPPRINPEGVGRNMSLYILMKRYDCNLKEYLLSGCPTIRTSILLLTQLFEAVAYINMQGVAHRDLKSDNILLDVQDDGAPILVITDFGCCLADKTNGLKLPYNSHEIDKGGNTALMAPEVITQTPGTFSTINYSKSDLWAVGCISYEIFGQENPFYLTESGSKLKSSNYKEDDLPDLPDDVPNLMKMLIRNILSRNPRNRVDPEIAANICQLYLWAPSNWLKPETKLPSSAEILQWLLCLTTKILCEGRLNKEMTEYKEKPQMKFDSSLKDTQFSYRTGRRTYPEYLLISSFLSRAKLAYIKSALSWIHNTY